MQLDINTLLAHLPHRYPFLLLDKVIHVEAGKSVTAQKNVTINEPCFQGHFPDHPVYPGVLILESMAQTTACLFIGDQEYTSQNQEKIYYLAGIDHARFKKQVVPGDVMLIQSHVIKKAHGMVKLQSEARVEDELVCSAEILVALR